MANKDNMGSIYQPGGPKKDPSKSKKKVIRRPGTKHVPGMAGGGATSVGAKPAGILASYTIKKGDTLSQIAKDHYGSGSQPYWKLIQEANKDEIKDANLIYPGQVIKIPVLPDDMKK